MAMHTRVGLGCCCGQLLRYRPRRRIRRSRARPVELVERSVRRGEGDPELADTLREQVEEPHRVSDRPVTSSHTANHPGTPGPAAKRRATRLGEIAKAAPELSPVTAGSISEAARRPDWRAPCILIYILTTDDSTMIPSLHPSF